jgi:hypothetical protein
VAVGCAMGQFRIKLERGYEVEPTLHEPLPPAWVTDPTGTLVDGMRWLTRVRAELAQGRDDGALQLVHDIGREMIFGAFRAPESVPAVERKRWLWREACARITERRRARERST